MVTTNHWQSVTYGWAVGSGHFRAGAPLGGTGAVFSALALRLPQPDFAGISSLLSRV